jgi:hypothetical protein
MLRASVPAGTAIRVKWARTDGWGEPAVFPALLMNPESNSKQRREAGQ